MERRMKVMVVVDCSVWRRFGSSNWSERYAIERVELSVRGLMNEVKYVLASGHRAVTPSFPQK